MIRYIEYLYLAAAVAVSAYFAVNFKTLPTGRMVFLGFVVLLAGFMYSFRRKQRQMIDELDARDAEEAKKVSDQSEIAADNKDESEQP
ncbi:MAG: hypothetical protein RLZZ519_346 [Bacteroidota bacterium]